MAPSHGEFPAHLSNTVTARWQRRLTGNPHNQRSHWRTKTAYYEAVGALIASGAEHPLSWRTIVAAVRPKGSRSTFYEVAGAHARHPLIADLIDDGNVDSIQLALCYRRQNAVEQLLDETKVWAYWPYRAELIARYSCGPMPTEAMVQALAQTVEAWASRHPRLAATLDCAPPACAVEDLLAILPGQLSAVRAAATLAEVVRRACGGAGPADSARLAG